MGLGSCKELSMSTPWPLEPGGPCTRLTNDRNDMREVRVILRCCCRALVIICHIRCSPPAYTGHPTMIPQTTACEGVFTSSSTCSAASDGMLLIPIEDATPWSMGVNRTFDPLRV